MSYSSLFLLLFVLFLSSLSFVLDDTLDMWAKKTRVRESQVSSTTILVREAIDRQVCLFKK
jgi:hypothetical protein